MPSLRDIRTRIGSVKSTKQITSAMKMVSAAKLRRAMESATSARPYQERLTTTIQRVAKAAGETDNPLMNPRETTKNVLLVVIGTDRGLCGGFNGTLNRRVQDWVEQQKAAGHTVAIRTYGKKPRDFMKSRQIPVAEARIDVTNAKYVAEAATLGLELSAAFVEERADEVWLAYNKFKSTLVQVPTFAKILPLSIEAGGDEPASGPDFIYEPAGAEILDVLLPLHLRTQLLQAFLETEAGEQAARMTAMDSATRNASDLISSLTLTYNRGRQAAITKELIEIVSGAEAL
jgi:F-type H+-transporting ATPase subunit gamma